MKLSFLIIVLVLSLPLAVAYETSSQPAPGVPGSKIIFVDRAKHIVKSPYQSFTTSKIADYRRSWFNPHTYKMEGDVPLVEKTTPGLKYASQQGYLGYGIPNSAPTIGPQGVFRNYKLIYGVDTQIIKSFKMKG